ncbi:MAG: autotransporter domain-containing protein, partial [Hyphomicrobiales bacterium]|nr:autotransporter domain-containing protein [Hyphomicrobiales bacterium]
NNSGTITANGAHQAFAVLVGSQISGGLVNSGTINANGGFIAEGVNADTISGGILNSGTISASANGANANVAFGVVAQTVTGATVNSGTITVNGPIALGIEVLAGSGGVANMGQITVNAAKSNAVGILVNTQSGAISNSGSIVVNPVTFGSGISVAGGSVGGGIANSGTITVSGAKNEAFGISVSQGTVVGGISNIGTITATGSGAKGFVDGIFIQAMTTIAGGITNGGTINGTGVNFTRGIESDNSTTSGGIGNAGSITLSGKTGLGIFILGSGAHPASTVSGGIANSGTISVNAGRSATGIRIGQSTVSGGVVNSGAITANSSGGVANGIVVANNSTASVGATVATIANSGTIAVSAKNFAEAVSINGGTVTGGITNTGAINAAGRSGTGILVFNGGIVAGGITNTGTISGTSAAIDLSGTAALLGGSVTGEGGPTVINQKGGALIGSVIGNGNTKGDVLNLSGGQIVLSPTQSISGFGTYNQIGGTLVFNVTQSTAPGTYPTLSAGSINLRGGTLELVPAAASLFALAAQGTTVYKNAIAADPPLSGNFASVTTPITLFQASTQPDPTTANALDAILSLSRAGLAASAQDLTQDARLSLDAPRVLTEAVQDRLVANGGALGEWAPTGTPGALSKGPASFAFGNADVWARGFDQFGSATDSAASAGVGYDVNRASPFIAGVDWRLDNGIVAGVAATYVATSARFKDGSSTNVNSYQGAAYAGWAAGPWYALGSAVVSFNDFGTSRLLTPFGLPGDATSSPSGQSYQGHAEAGYHWVLPAGGVNLSVTPYAALDYVNAHLSGFSETGGFGALSVNAADGNSFQTTLGVRLTSRIAMAGYGTLVPEVRLGWSHEFLDASQQITAALVGVPGASFSATGIPFGRDAALLGAGFSMELSPEAKVFVDYNGRLASRLQEHAVSGGLRVRF